MTSTEEGLQETIAIEHVSMSHIRFFVSTQLNACRNLQQQTDEADEDMRNEEKTDDEREEAHKRYRELMEEPCPVITQIEAIVEDFVLRFDHDCRGLVDIDINLATMPDDDIASAVFLLTKQIVKILTEGMLSFEEPRVLNYGTL